MIRKNVKEDKYSDGVDLYLEVQYIDIETCEPVPGVYVDIWNANATGVYSGIYTRLVNQVARSESTDSHKLIVATTPPMA